MTGALLAGSKFRKLSQLEGSATIGWFRGFGKTLWLEWRASFVSLYQFIRGNAEVFHFSLQKFFSELLPGVHFSIDGVIQIVLYIHVGHEIGF